MYDCSICPASHLPVFRPNRRWERTRGWRRGDILASHAIPFGLRNMANVVMAINHESYRALCGNDASRMDEDGCAQETDSKQISPIY